MYIIYIILYIFHILHNMWPLERLIGSLYIYIYIFVFFFCLLCPPETQREDAERQSAGLLAPSSAILGSILVHLRSISA